MRKSIPFIVAGMGLLAPSFAAAQSSLPPGVTLTIEQAPALTFELADNSLIVEPANQVAFLRSGLSVGSFYFTMLSRVHTEVILKFSDSRIQVPEAINGKLTLFAGSLRSINVTAFGAHSGTISVYNTEGTLLHTLNYTVSPAKAFNNSLSASYNNDGSLNIGYTLTNNPINSYDPRYGVSVSGSYNSKTNAFTGTVGVNVNW